jgi:two-component system, chemotaxis family, chemotaxis protein CheY
LQRVLDTVNLTRITLCPVTRILIVDDRPDVRLAFCYMLEACGFAVFEAGDGDAALNCLARKAVDVILTDLEMPGMDGLSLIRTIGSAGPKIIAMTGAGNEEILERAENSGAHAVLEKPVSRETMVRTIRMVLGENHLHL